MTLRTAKLTWNPINPFKNAEISISEGEVEPCVQLGQKVENKSMLLTWLKCVEALPFDDIVSLVVDAPCDAGAWDNNLGHCGTVPRLILPNEQASLGFLKYLIATTEAGKGRRSGADTPFKSLEELTLHGVQYDRDLKSKVQAALTARNKRGFKLRKLTLQDCSVSAGSIKQLSTVVDVVEQHGEMKKGKQGNRV
ncbi:hypothetical protein BDN72DRAFT_391831 [Pluteus cervinus]|uniref:Uncharacterized protein n=1 Tax=Pluteus cervinus TaxID=181527 RepID=A0ACD3A9N5_9AGAR|nr:hypothetical protein BDN72DRAFT_391831 [Pluteus cervinus]